MVLLMRQILINKKVTYDSKTGLVTKKSKSDMINISKYFIILLLFYSFKLIIMFDKHY